MGTYQLGKVSLAVVCDGMGGNQGGAYASTLAIRTVHDAMVEQLRSGVSARDALIEAAKRANSAIFDASRRNHKLAGMATTLAAVAIEADVAHVVHVGDSRVYQVRGGEARSLTRDHTMVNLFVEAELLSPEDAASHPEAHVLSRSLGVERTVEVEVAAPVPVEYADTFVLTTDGAHMVLNEGDFGNIDWSDPQEGANEAMRLFQARRPEDCGTLVAVITGEFEGEPSPPTPVPQVEELSDPASTYEPEAPRMAPQQPRAPSPAVPGGMVEAPSFVDIPRTPAPPPVRERFVPPVAAPTTAPEPLVDVPDHPPAPSAAPKPAAARPESKPPPRAEKIGPSKAEAPAMPEIRKPPAGSRKGLWLAVIGAAGFTGVAVLGGVVWFVQSRAPAAPVASTAADTDAVAAVADPPSGPPPAAAVVAPTAPAVPVQYPIFAPEMPPEPKRPAHRTLKYLQPPPGGPEQLEAITAAREKDCAASLAAVTGAVSKSIDYASLYTHPWKCFNDEHQRPLIHGKATTIDEFAALIPHFEGEWPPIDPKAKPDKTPTWMRPAVGGIEYRLERFNASGDKDLLADVMYDKLGEQTVADHVFRDLWMEATAARGLSSMEAPDAQAIDWWARRVYVLQTSLNANSGTLLKRYHAEAHTRLLDALREVTRGADPKLFDQDPPLKVEEYPLPEPVWLAWGTALGKISAPENTPAGAPSSVAPKAPNNAMKIVDDDRPVALPPRPRAPPPPPPKPDKIKIH